MSHQVRGNPINGRLRGSRIKSKIGPLSNQNGGKGYRKKKKALYRRLFFTSGSGIRARTLTKRVRVVCATITQFRYLFKITPKCRPPCFLKPASRQVGTLFTASGFPHVTDLLTAVKPRFPNLECGFKIQSVTHTPGKQYLIFVYYDTIIDRDCKPYFYYIILKSVC